MNQNLQHILTLEPLTLAQIGKIVSSNNKIVLGQDCIDRVTVNRNYLEAKISQDNKTIYGINTGFGSLCDTIIPQQGLEELQRNLVLSHSCGTGPAIPQLIAKIVLLLKIKNLSLGCSGVRISLVERLVNMYNEDMIPELFEMGSLGASGDLAPLAHLAATMLGEGYVNHKGNKISAKEALEILGEEPFILGAKEGLALLNGTQFSTAYALYSVLEANRLLSLANHTAAMSMDAFMCSLDPLDEDIHRVRNQRGQIAVAAEIRGLLVGSQLAGHGRYSVQDPYSFRCVPQVHGASHDAIAYASDIVEREINAVTDNPNIFDREDKILSGGNFHAQPIALALDFLAIALSELGSISERRTYVFLGANRELPSFLIADAGLNSGMMILQYTAASIASQNKQLCTPASVDSIISCNGQEDHVSMAANAGTKCYRVVQNLKSLIAIELILSAQAKDFRKGVTSGSVVESMHASFRSTVPFIKSDMYSKDLIVGAEAFVEKWNA